MFVTEKGIHNLVIYFCRLHGGHVSSVDIANSQSLEWAGIDSRWERFLCLFKPASRATQLSFHSGYLVFSGGRAAGACF